MSRATDRGIIDITVPVGEGMPTWPGDPEVSITPTSRTERGDDASVSELRMGTHTGTHVDPPAHFLTGGATVEDIPLSTLVGPALVADARGLPGPLGPAELEALRLPAGTARLLLRTDNSALWGGPVAGRWVALSGAGAEWLVARGLDLVGIDYLSVDAADADGYPAHQALLTAGVVILEGLDLSAAPPGPYTLVALPLRLQNADGAPVRAVLLPPPAG